MKAKKDKTSICSICQWHGVSPQSYYKYLRVERKSMYEEEVLLEMVRERRKELRFEGYVKLYDTLKPQIKAHGFKIGRDKFRMFLKAHDLHIKRKKKYVNTTNSLHRYRVYENLIKGMKVSRINEVWVSDITYIRVGKGFMYLSLITDLYSRKIVGHHLSHSLAKEGCIKALRMALGQRKDKTLGLIHHSDRGFQYCSHAYVNILKSNNAEISMAAKGNCYENATAERVNGILKEEFQLDSTFPGEKVAQKAVRQSITAYNELRKHYSLNLETPSQRHAA